MDEQTRSFLVEQRRRRLRAAGYPPCLCVLAKHAPPRRNSHALPHGLAPPRRLHPSVLNLTSPRKSLCQILTTPRPPSAVVALASAPRPGSPFESGGGFDNDAGPLELASFPAFSAPTSDDGADSWSWRAEICESSTGARGGAAARAAAERAVALLRLMQRLSEAGLETGGPGKAADFLTGTAAAGAAPGAALDAWPLRRRSVTDAAASQTQCGSDSQTGEGDSDLAMVSGHCSVVGAAEALMVAKKLLDRAGR